MSALGTRAGHDGRAELHQDANSAQKQPARLRRHHQANQDWAPSSEAASTPKSMVKLIGETGGDYEVAKFGDISRRLIVDGVDVVQGFRVDAPEVLAWVTNSSRTEREVVNRVARSSVICRSRS